MWEHIGPVAAVLALLLSAVTVGIGGILKYSMSRMETSLVQIELSLRKAIADTAKEIDERIDQQARHFGENINALRAKITEVELYVRDTYVRRESFYTVKDDLQGDIKELGKELSKRLDRMEQIIINGAKD